MAQLNFDATQVAPDQGVPDALPAGYYNVAIDESEIKPTKDGSGSYLQLRFNILDGQYAGRKTFARLNIVNPNPIAQEIGLKQLSAVGHAVNVLHIADSTQLHAIPMQIKLKVRVASGDYEASNEVSGYFAAGTHATGGTTASTPVGGGASVGGGFPFQQAQTQQVPAQGQGWNQPAGQQPWNQGGQPASNTAQQPVGNYSNAPAQQPWTQPQGQVQQPQGQQQQAPQGQQAWNQPAVQQQVQQPAQTDWANGQVQQAPAQAQQQVQQQAQAPINQQPAHINVPNGQTAQTMTPPWAQS